MRKSAGRPTDQLIETAIHDVRGQRVLLDTDLASIYGVATYRLNEAVKRNRNRFPEDFVFRLSKPEWLSLTSRFAMSKKGRGGRRTLPYAFTQHGAIMAATVLNSTRAVQTSIYVVRAFVRMRSALSERGELKGALEKLERELTQRLNIHEGAIVGVLKRIMELIDPPERELPQRKHIGF